MVEDEGRRERRLESGNGGCGGGCPRNTRTTRNVRVAGDRRTESRKRGGGREGGAECRRSEIRWVQAGGGAKIGGAAEPRRRSGRRRPTFGEAASACGGPGMRGGVTPPTLWGRSGGGGSRSGLRWTSASCLGGGSGGGSRRRTRGPAACGSRGFFRSRPAVARGSSGGRSVG